MSGSRAVDLLYNFVVTQQLLPTIECNINELIQYSLSSEASQTTFLHHAAMRGELNEIQYLVDMGVSVHIMDIIGRTPFVAAIECKRYKAALMLLELGSEPECSSKYCRHCMGKDKRICPPLTSMIDLQMNCGEKLFRKMLSLVDSSVVYSWFLISKWGPFERSGHAIPSGITHLPIKQQRIIRRFYNKDINVTWEEKIKILEDDHGCVKTSNEVVEPIDIESISLESFQPKIRETITIRAHNVTL